MKKIKCPVCNRRGECVACNGAGQIAAPKNETPRPDSKKMAKAAKKLHAKNYTFREIAGLLGYKYAQSIKHLLDNY